MISRLLASFYLFLICSISANAQDIGEIIFGQKPKSDYIGQYKDNHKQKNGMGIQRLKKGSVYIGDFSDGKMSGKGMLFAGQNDLPNIPGTMVYVGHLINGKKERNGVCYAPNGDILYKGRFSDDKPVDVYPQSDPDELSFFTMMEWGDDLYWGEVRQGVPHGAALVMNDDGTLWYGTHEAGEKKGICISIFGEDSWEVGVWENNEYKAFNSSEIVAERRQQYVEARSALRSELRKEFWNAALGLTQSVLNIASEASRNKRGAVDVAAGTATEVDTGARASGGNNASKGDKTTASASSGSESSCGTAWLIESRAYSNYETLLIYHGEDMTADEIKDVREKMKKIRTKWEKRGCPFTQSTLE